MDLNQLQAYYQSCSDITSVNYYEEDYYWLEALDRLDINQIKIGYEKPTDNVYFSPPYFVIPQFLFSEFVGLSLRSYDGKQNYRFSPLGLSVYSAERTKNMTMMGPDYNDVVVVSEGPMDAEVLSNIHPYSLAGLMSVPSGLLLKTLSSLVRKMIYIPDKDQEGKIKNRLKKSVRRVCIDPFEFDIITLSEVDDPGGFVQEGFDSNAYKTMTAKLKLTIKNG